MATAKTISTKPKPGARPLPKPQPSKFPASAAPKPKPKVVAPAKPKAPAKPAPKKVSPVKAAVKKATTPVKKKVGTPGYRVVMVDGKRMLMQNAKADAYEADQAAQLIPSNLRSLVDPLAISKSVKASIAAANAPVLAENAANKATLTSNLARNGELTTGTQQSIAQALAQQNMLTAAMQAAQKQQADAMLASSQRTAQQQQAMLGPDAQSLSMDPDVRAAQALRDFNITREGNAAQYGSQAQANWMTRAGAIAAQSAADWERAQRARLATVEAVNQGKIAANNAALPDLMRKYAQEDYTLASAFAGSQADAAAKEAAAKVDAYNAETNRMKVGASARNAAAAANAKLTAAQQKRVDNVFAQVEKMRAKIGTRLGPGESYTVRNEKTGKMETIKTPGTVITAQMVFGTNGGPLRKSFDLLRSVGLTKEQAAWQASLLYRDSLTRSNPANIAILWKNRGVSPKAARMIIDDVWGAGTYAQIGKPKPRVPGPAKPKPATGKLLDVMQSQASAAKWKKGSSFVVGKTPWKVLDVKWSPRGLTVTVQPRAGGQRFTGLVMTNGPAPVRPGLPPVAIGPGGIGIPMNGG